MALWPKRWGREELRKALRRNPPFVWYIELNEDGTPKLDANGQWIWKRRE